MEPDLLSVRFGDDAVDIPFYRLGGAHPGPHIFLSGGMHGGEINGVGVIESFLGWAESVDLPARLKGTITVLPVLNPSGFAHRQRYVYEDNVDMNRAFGIAAPATLAEQIALDLTERLLRHCEFGIDFHDASGPAALLPHARVHKNEACGCTHQMAQLFGTRIIIAREGKPNMMAIAMNQGFGIPVLTVEVGGSQRLFPDFVAQAVQGIRNFLSAKRMFAGKIIVPERQFMLQRRYGIKAKEAAMIELDVELGDQVHYDDVLGRLYFPERLERRELRSPMCGFIFSLQQLNQVVAGDTLFSILESDQCHVDRTTLNEFREMENLKVTKIRM